MSTRIMAVALVCGGFMAIAGQPPTTWYVDDDCVAPGSGTEADPFCLIQDCIEAAMDGDECVVADGTYIGDGNRDLDFGGRLITLRSANGPDNCIIDCEGTHRGFIFHNGETEDAVVEGFTITNGHVSFPGNGGGMFIFGSSPTLTNCTFSGNTALLGGGMCNHNSSLTVTGCTFVGNTASDSGGGMWNSGGGSPTVSDCTFFGNTASSVNGGGMGNNSSSPVVTHCTFIGNTAGFRGGGMSNGGSSPVVTHCTFIGNTAGFLGGGMFNFNTSSPWVTHCTFSENDADEGRALAFDSFRQQLPSDLSMTNCILWDGGGEIWNNDNSIINIAYSDVQGGWPGEGNIDADPLFVDSGFWDDNGTPEIPEDDFWGGGDYHLLPGSPCIDAGDNTAVPEGIETDLDGNPRFVDDPNTDDTGFGDPPIVDMGAYEFQDPCADDDGDGKVTICHIPPGNPDNAHTITVSANAVPAHLAHGDQCGPCEGEGGLPLSSSQSIAVPVGHRFSKMIE